MNKKAIIILAAIFLLIVGTLGFLIYSRSSSNGEDPAPIVDNGGANPLDGSGAEVATTTPELPSAEKFTKLTASEAVVSPVLFYNGNGVTYIDSQGELIKAD